MAFIGVDSAGFLCVRCDYQNNKGVRDLGASWDSVDKCWRLVFTAYNLEQLIDSYPEACISEDLEILSREQLTKEGRLRDIKLMSQQDSPVRFKITGLKLPAYNYQKLGVMFAVTNGAGTLIADEMGLGKTIQAIATALYLKSIGKAKNALIVTPASLKFNWPIEIEKFSDEKYIVIDGTSEERIVQWLKHDIFFYIVNYELLLEDLFGGRKFREKDEESIEAKNRRERLVAKVKQRERILLPIRQKIWDFIAIDEAHLIKAHAARRSRVTKQLRAKFKMALTGTPMDGRLEELHSVMEFVAPGLLGSKLRFFQRHIETDIWGRVKSYKRLAEVTKKIEPFFIRRMKKEVLKDLPDKIYENRMVVLSDVERKIYKQLAERGHDVTVDEEAIVAILRCKQFCNWPPMIDELCKETTKMDSFKEVLEEVIILNGHKVLVFSQYKEMLNVIQIILDEMGLKYLRIDGDTGKQKRVSMQQQFNTDSSIDLMIGTEAMALGLNLVAADYVVNYDDNWSPSVMSQREDRSHRLGQKNVVTVVNFICKGTIEENIRGVIYGKNKLTAEVLGDNVDELILKRMSPTEIVKLL